MRIGAAENRNGKNINITTAGSIPAVLMKTLQKQLKHSYFQSCGLRGNACRHEGRMPDLHVHAGN